LKKKKKKKENKTTHAKSLLSCVVVLAFGVWMSET